MPETKTKRKIFLDPAEVLAQTSLEEGMSVADFGCGNGYYAVAAAKLVGSEGQVYALDILEEALSQSASLAKLEGLYNVSTIQCDLETLESCGIDDTSCDLVILGSLLHQLTNRDNVLRQAYRVLKTGGQLLVVEWKTDAEMGPKQEQRLDMAEVRKMLEERGLRPVKELDAGSFHYALLYEK